MLVLKWTLVGFLLTISYKSVLRAMMMTVEYEDTIDTFEDVLLSGRKYMVTSDTAMRYLLEDDPRPNRKQLAKDAQYYKYGTGNPEWVKQG